MGFFLSPQVAVIEKDLTTYIPALPTSITGVVGDFTWGPINERVLITNEKELIEVFGKPTSSNYEHFFSAWNYLQYAGQLYVVRAGSDAGGSTVSNSNVLFSPVGVTSSETVAIKNTDDYLMFIEASLTGFMDSDAIGFISRYPGDTGDRLKIAVTGYSINTLSTVFSNAATVGQVSTTIGNVGWTNILPNKLRSDERNLGVAIFMLKEGMSHSDNLPGNYDLVEKWTVSTTNGKRDSDGNSIYVEDVINQSSRYVYAFGAFGSACIATYSAAAANLTTGCAGTYSTGAVMLGYDLFSNPEEFDVNILIDGGNTSATIQQYIIDSVISKRMDCIGIFSPPKAQVVNVAAGLPQIIANLDTYVNVTLARGASSYAAIYGNWKYQYDKYNDKYRWLPLSGDMAGIYAQTDFTRDPWFAPAGFNRGAVRNVSRLAFTPDLPQRNMLYKENINPVVQFRGEGPIVFGQKTLLNKPSAFDRVDVRRLFLVLEKAISTASKYFLFEKNTDFTRRQLVGMIEPFLRDVKGREGLYDFRVKCDETNNTGEVIDRNELICDIYLKPTKTAEFIQLNFIATRTGVSFEEVGA